jgi:hypothetical protein
MTRIRKCLKLYSDEAIMEEGRDQSGVQPRDDFLMLARHHMHNAGTFRGPHIWIYNEHGEGIRSKFDMWGLTHNYGNPTPAGKKLWVIPADVHY